MIKRKGIHRMPTENNGIVRIRELAHQAKWDLDLDTIVQVVCELNQGQILFYDHLRR